MRKPQRTRVRLAFFSILPVLLLIAAIVPVFLMASSPAGALGNPEWLRVQGYINSYISSQYQAGSDGEAGFLMDAATLHGRIDTNNNIGTLGPGGVLGEGDDAAGAPVLVDVLVSTGNVIPGSSVRCMWNGTTGNGCLEANQVNAIKNRVDAHLAAGFSTDVVAYCATGHTESPTAGGFGFIAQAGGLSSTGTPPDVYAFKWGRNGWQNVSRAYGNSYATVTPGAPATNPPATNPTVCNGVTPDAELVRCTALWMVSAAGGNIGNGVNPPLSGYQVVDIRPGPVAATANGGILPSINVPINTIFNYGQPFLNPDPGAAGGTEKLLFVNRTQHTAGIVAAGARMLGYPAAFLQWGLANYNNLLPEKMVGGGVAYPVQSATSGAMLSGIDTIAPTIVSGPTISNVTATSVDISRITSEPATSKIHLAGSDGHEIVVNSTVLNAAKTVTISGLHPGVTYAGILTVYDGQANGTSAMLGMTLPPPPPPPMKPDLSLSAPASFWGSYADYTARQLSVTWTVNNIGLPPAQNVALTSSAATYTPITTLTGMPATIGNIAAGASGSVVVQYQLPPGFSGGGFHVVNTATAEDWAGFVYMYP